MEEEVKNEEYYEEEEDRKPKKPGFGFFVAGIVFAIIAVITFIMLNQYGHYLFNDVDSAGEAIANVFLLIIFLPFFLGVGGLSSLLSAIFSTVSFVKYKRSIPRIILFAFSLTELVSFIVFVLINTLK